MAESNSNIVKPQGYDSPFADEGCFEKTISLPMPKESFDYIEAAMDKLRSQGRRVTNRSFVMHAVMEYADKVFAGEE